MINELTKDIWNNFIVIPYNKNKKYEFSVSKLKKIIEGHLGIEEIVIKNKPFVINQSYKIKWATGENFIIKEIKFKFDRNLKKETPYYFLGIIQNKEYLGLCPLNIDRLIPNNY